MRRTVEWMRGGILAVLVIAGVAAPTAAQVLRGGGQGVGAEAMGMGGAFTAVANDPSAVYWNPAGLAQLSRVEVMGMLSSLFNDKSRDSFLAVHYPTKDDIHLGLSYSNLFFTGVRGAHEDHWTGSAAIPATKDHRLLLGVSLNYLYSDLKTAGGIGRGAGLDIGALYLLPLPRDRQLRFGLFLNDVSTTMRFNDGMEQTIPRTLTPSVAFRPDPFTLLAVDLGWSGATPVQDEGRTRFRAGAERRFFNGRWALRAGYEHYTTLPGALALGTGYSNDRWSVSYAFLTHSNGLGDSHRLSTTWMFDPPGASPSMETAPVGLRALVGDGRIHLSWSVTAKAPVEGYWVYYRSDDEKEYHQRRPEVLGTDYCVLRGAQNGVKYHVYLCLVIDGKQSKPSNEIVVVPRPILDSAKEAYDAGVVDLDAGKLEEGLASARKAEELDPGNIDIKELIRRLQKAREEAPGGGSR